MTDGRVLAATYRGDLSADRVVLEANRRGIEIVRFNTEDYPAEVGLSFDPLRPEGAELTIRDHSVSFGDLDGIWVRRIRWPTISPVVTDPLDRQYASQDAVAAIGGLLRLFADKCVSPPDAMQAARWKLPQLSLAKRLGMACPQTIVTNDPALIEAFVAEGRAVLKSVADAWVEGATGERHGLTTELGANDDVTGARIAPVTVQRLVPKRADARVTVIGDRVFAVRMVPPPDSPVDVRATPTGEIHFEAVTLDARLERTLLEYVRLSGLRFAAIDLVEDTDGVFWFLECNPGGQWVWLEDHTGLPMTTALLDLLLNPG